MQNESCNKFSAVNSKVSESEILTDSFIEDLLDAVDETLVPITYDKTENFSSSCSVSPLWNETTIGNITKDQILPTTSIELCNFPPLTFGMELSISEALFPKEMNLEECEKDQGIILEKIKISEPNVSTMLKQTQKAKPEQKLTSYNILINSFVNDNKKVSKESKNSSEQKQLASIKIKRNGSKNENTQKSDIKVSVEHKLIDSPQSKEYDKKSDNEQSKMKELEYQRLDICEEKVKQIPKEDGIDEHKHTQVESKGLNIKESELEGNQPSKDENEHINSAIEKKCEGSLAESVQNGNFGLQCTKSKHGDGKYDKSEKMTEKDQNNHFETHLIKDENINKRNSEEHLDEESDEYIVEESDEYIAEESDEYLDIQSDEYPDEQSEEHPNKYSDEHPDKLSDEPPNKQSDEHSDKQSDEPPHKQSDEPPHKQSDEHPNKQSDEHSDKQSDEHPYKQSDEHPHKQSDEPPDKQSDEHPDKQPDEHLDKQSVENQKKSKTTPQKRLADSFSKHIEKDTHFKNQCMLKDKEKKNYIEENKQCDAEQDRATLLIKKKIKNHDDHPSMWTEKDPDTDVKKQLIKSEEIYSVESENENDQVKSKEKKKLKNSDELSSKQTKNDSNISSKKKLTKSKDNFKSDSDIDEYTQSEDEQAKSKSKKKLISPNKHPWKQIEKDSNTNFKKRLAKLKEIDSDESENNESNKTKCKTKNKPKKIDESSSKQTKRNSDIISKNELTKSNEIYSNESEKEFDAEDEQIKSKTKIKLKSSDESSSKQTKRDSDISKKQSIKSQEIYLVESENEESEEENNQVKPKDKKKLKSTDESSRKQTIKDSDIISKKRLTKVKEIDSNENEKESNVEDEQTRSIAKNKLKSSDESSRKYPKRDSNVFTAVALTKSKEKHKIDSEINDYKQSEDECEQTKSNIKKKLKSSDKCPRKEIEKGSNTHSKKQGTKAIELDSEENENKDTDDEDKQTKCNAKKKFKSSDESSSKLTKIDSDLTFKEKSTKSKEIDSNKNENKEFNDEDKKQFNAKKKLKSSDESFSKLTKINSDTFTKKKLTNPNSRKNIDFDKSENQVFEVDLEKEKSKAKNKRNSSDGDVHQISKNNPNHNSENQVTKFQGNEAFGDGENAQSDAEKEQVDSKAKKEVKIADESSSKQPEKDCDKDEDENMHIMKPNKKTNSEEKNNKIEKDLPKNLRQQKLKSKKEEGSKKQSRVPRTYKRKNKNVKENVSCLSKNNEIDNKDMHASTDNDRKGSYNENIKEPLEIEKMYASQIKPCKIVLERLKNLDMDSIIKDPTNDTQFNVLKKQNEKQNMDKCVEKSKSKLEKLKGKKDIYDCNSEGTCGESISKPDVDKAQSNNADSDVLDKPKERQPLVKQVNGKRKISVKGKNNVSDQNIKETSSESESEPVADKFQLEELKQKQQPKKNVKKSNAKLGKLKKGQLKGKKNNASAYNSDEISSETYSKPVADEAQSNNSFTELLEKPNERGLLQNRTEQSKAKLTKFGSVKSKGKKGVSDCKETSSEMVCNPDTDESQSEALNKSKEKLHSKKLIEKSETKLEKAKVKKDTSDYNNKETFCEDVSKPDTHEAQSDAGHSEVLKKSKDKYLLEKHAGKSKAVLRFLKKNLDKVKLKGKKDVSVRNSKEVSEERDYELDVDKSQSDELNQKEHSEKTVEESEAKLEKFDKVKEKKDASEQNNDKTSSECVSKPDTDEAKSNAGQSEVLDVPKDKQLLTDHAENSKAKLKRMDKGKDKDLPDHNNEETSTKSESKHDADETQSEELKKPKQKQHSKKPVEKFDAKLEKAKEKNNASDPHNEETSCEGVSNLDETEAQSNAGQQEVLDKPNEKNFKGKKDLAGDKSEETSSENVSEPDSDETRSEAIKKSKQKQHSEKPVNKSEAKLEKSEKVNGKKDASDLCNEETSNEGVSKLDINEAQSSIDQSIVLDEPKDKQLIEKDAEKSELKNFDKVKFKGKKDVSDLNSEETLGENESEPESDKSQSKKLKQKQQSKKNLIKSNVKLAKLEKVQMKGENNDAPDHNIEVILSESDSKPNADKNLVKPEINSENDCKKVEKNSCSKSKKRKFEPAEEIESLKYLKLNSCKVVIEQCNFSHIEKTLTLDKKITLQVSKKDSVVEEEELTDISQNADIHIAIADQCLTEKNASVLCEDENEVQNETIYLVQDEEDKQADITDNIQPEDIDHSLSNYIVAVCDQHKKNASVLKDQDKEEEKTSNIQSQDYKDIDNSQSDDAAAVEDKCPNENAKKTSHGEEEVQAEIPCNIQSQDSKRRSKAKVKKLKSSKSIDHNEESEKGNDLNAISASNTKGKDSEYFEKRQTAECQSIEDCTSTVHGYEQSKECHEKQLDSMHKSEEDLGNVKSSDEGTKASENLKLEKVYAAQSKREEVSTIQQEVKKRDKNSKLLNQNPKATFQGTNSAKSKESHMEVFENNLIISDENQTGTDECVGRYPKKISTNKLVDKSKRLSIIKPCSVILEKFSSSFKSNVDDTDEVSLSSNGKESSENESRKGKKHSRRRLSHVNFFSKRKRKTDDDLDSSCSDSGQSFEDKDVKHSKKKRQSIKLKQSSYARSLIKRKHKHVISDLNKDSASICNDFEGSSENEDVKDSGKKKQLIILKPSNYANSSNKKKLKNVISAESCSDSKESSDDGDVKGSRKQKQSNILKPSRYVSASSKRKRKTVSSDEGSGCSDSKESSDGGDKKEQSNLLKLSSSASSSIKRKRKNLTSVEGSSSNYSDSKNSSYEADVKGSKKTKLSNNLKQMCLVSPSSKKKHKKVTSDSGEALDSSCSDSKESSKYVKNSKNKKHSNKLKQLIRGHSSNKRRRKNDSTSNSDEEWTSCCSSSEESSEYDDLKIKRETKSYKLKRFVRSLADDKIVRHLSCKSCKLSFKTCRQWVKHDKEFHKSFVYKCDLCYGELFKSHGSYVNHMKYFHPYEKLFFCKYRKCRKGFSSLKKFRNHHKSHYKFRCKYCKEGFTKEYQMYGHVIKYHVK